MSKTKVYIGTDLLDFEEEINIKRQLNDYNDLSIGSNVTSYTINIPNTRHNIPILKNISDIRSTEQVTGKSTILVGGMQAIKGKFRILSSNIKTTKAIIEGNDWIGELSGISIQDVWDACPTDCHTFTSGVVETSWTAASGALFRYPLVNFAQLYSEENASGARVMPYDFYPIWSIKKIIEKIFSYVGVQIASNFFGTTEGEKLYLESAPNVNEDDFISEKLLDVKPTGDSENRASITHVAAASQTVILTKDPISHNTKTTDEGGDYNTTTDKYTVPATGTYRFKTQMSILCTHNDGSFTITNQNYTFRIYKNTTILYSVNDSSLNAFLAGVTHSIDTGWIHLEEGDEIYTYFDGQSNAVNNSATVTVFLDLVAADTQLYNTVDERNLWPGIGKSISPAEYLPDILCIDFLKALKSAYNLRFWLDDLNNEIYLMTSDDFYGSTVIDWTGKEDYSSDPVLNIIAANYKKIQELKWSADTGDSSYNNEVAANGTPFMKTLTIDSEYAQQGKDEITNSQFNATVVSDMSQIGHVSGLIPAIRGNDEYVVTKRYPQYRSKIWAPRLLKWNGMITLVTGSFDYYDDVEDAAGTTYATFPSVECPDFEDLFNDYMVKDFRIIEKGKSISMLFSLPITEIAKFGYVVGTAANEGFRVKYKINIEGVDAYFRVSGTVTNGDRIKCEIVQTT